MSTRSIRTSHEHDVCDVCERTLLRGEQTEVFVNGGRRYSVCELCKPRALHEGWMREGTIPEYPEIGADRERRRSLFGRRRGRPARAGRSAASDEPDNGPQTLDDELSLGDWPRHSPPIAPPAAAHTDEHALPRDHYREPRHVHAIPTSGEHKMAAAVDAFNRTEHRRTVAGVARSLGIPSVNVTPDGSHPSLVWVVVAWELCWYRYEVDLSDVRGTVRLDGQGYELDELSDYERATNATADDNGSLSFV